MSKFIAASAMALGGGGVAVTGAYALGAFGGSGYELPKTLQDFKQSNGGSCIKEVFSSIEGGKMGEGLTLTDVSTTGDVSLETGTDKEEKGCLVVNLDKWNSSDGNKWRGNFRFLWAFAKGNKGFVVYTSANTSANTSIKSDSSDAEFAVQGIAYTLDKKQPQVEGNEVWEIKKKLEASDKKLVKTSLKDGKIPAQGTALEGFVNNSFWNLEKEELNKDKMCTKEEDCNQRGKYFRGYWSWQTVSGTGKKNLGDWSSEVDTWWKEIYDDSNTKWNMKDIIKDISGKWVKR